MKVSVIGALVQCAVSGILGHGESSVKVLRPYRLKIKTTKPKMDCNLLDYMTDFILTATAMYAASDVFEKRGISFTK